MPVTLGYHWVKTGYGLWLPGDSRGHWSTAWDEQIGFMRPHMLNEGDPARKRMAQELMKHAEVKFTQQMIEIVVRVIGECAGESPWKIAAGSVESTHTHLLFTYSKLDIHRSVKWISQRTTKAIHQETSHLGPVWGKSDWTSYIFESEYFMNVKRYIENHNVRRGTDARPYAFISDVIL
ncbi:MAG TPA: transposase [Tepidisphaeraceae bacterium]|nr:transposase [Tepidisphaeraceae bacterium]